MFFFIFLLRTHYESTHRLCGEKWWPEIRLRSQAAPHVILPEFTFLRQSHCSVMLNCFILPVYKKMFGVFRTKLQRQNQGFLGGLTHTVIYLKLTQNISIISRTKGLILKTFATLRNGKKSIQTVTNHVNSWSAKLRRGHSGALPQIYRKPVFSQH